jgi:hypothetical protein
MEKEGERECACVFVCVKKQSERERGGGAAALVRIYLIASALHYRCGAIAHGEPKKPHVRIFNIFFYKTEQKAR